MADQEPNVIHDEVEIEDFEYNEQTEEFKYPCPCGDEFVVTKSQLLNGDKYARCPSCSLIVKVIYDDPKQLIQAASAS